MVSRTLSNQRAETNDMTKPNAIGEMLALLVHDLRNPAATLTANVDYLTEVVVADQDAREAIDDLRTALRDLRDGLTRVSWIADGMLDRRDSQMRDGDVAGAIQHRFPHATTEGENFSARGGATIDDVVAIFVENGLRHDRNGEPDIVVIDEGETVLIRIDAKGAPIDEALREEAFTIEGQNSIKGRAGGRYARFCGLAAASAFVTGLGGTLTAGEHEGRDRTELRLPRP